MSTFKVQISSTLSLADEDNPEEDGLQEDTTMVLEEIPDRRVKSATNKDISPLLSSTSLKSAINLPLLQQPNQRMLPLLEVKRLWIQLGTWTQEQRIMSLQSSTISKSTPPTKAKEKLMVRDGKCLNITHVGYATLSNSKTKILRWKNIIRVHEIKKNLISV